MTIARVAQDKFEYQDLVGLLFALVGLDDATLEVRSEPDGGEDVEVRATISGAGHVFDLQVKDEQAGLDLDRLALHLAHPTPHRTDETLLDRLEANATCTAVIVTSGRLKDDALAFAAPDDWTGQSVVAAAPSTATAKLMIAAFGKVELSGTAYEVGRRAHRQAVAGRLKPRAAQQLLRRVVVLERVTYESLLQRCVDQVARRTSMPSAAARHLIDPLLRVVRDAKRTGSDFAPGVRQLLTDNRQSRFGSPDYLDRGPETAWLATLEREHVLLIGGPPRSGKTQTAEHLADRLVSEGFEVIRADDHVEARRLFHDGGGAHRVVFLDDPLGDGWTIANVPGAYQGLRALVHRAGPGRLLLVAQNQTPLFNAAGVGTLAQVNTGGRGWVDLAGHNPDLNVRVWRSTAEEARVPKAAVDRLAAALRSGAVRVDLGALTHLAFSGRIQETTSIAEMVAIADQGGAEFAHDLAAADPDAADLLAAVAVTTDESVGLDDSTSAFVIEGAAGARPAHINRMFRVREMGGDRRVPVFPVYKPEPVLSEVAALRIEALENRRILTRVDGRLQISHGFYRAAALGLLTRPSLATATRHLETFERGLFGLDPKTSRATARNLTRVWAALPEEARPRLVAMAVDGLSALYPGTRDLCWRFLIAQFDQLPEKTRSNLPQWLRNAYSTELDDLVWKDGEAWITADGTSVFDSRMFRHPRLKDVRFEVDGLNGTADFAISPERAEAVLGYYATTPGRLTRRAAQRLLAMDEAVLRGEAARIWVSEQRSHDKAVLDQIFEERHPRIASDVLDGVARGWSGLTKARKHELVARLKPFVASPAVAVPLVDSLVLIDREEVFGANPPWPLFAELLPVLLDQLTDRATGAEPRLFTAVETAVVHLPAHAIVEICRAWIGWLTRTTRSMLRSDYAWGVISILIEATRKTPELRAGLLAPLFSHVDQSGAAVMLVHEFVEEWSDLTDAEKDLLRALLRRSRKDGDWLRGVVLTRRRPPGDLVKMIVGAPFGTADEIEGQLTETLFDASVEVFLGIQPFAYLGISGRDREPWRSVANQLARQPAHRLGRMCMENMIQHEQTDRLMAVLPSWGSRLDEVFDLLLRHHLGTAGGPELKPAWNWVFSQATDAQRAAWDQRIAIEVADLVDGVFELDRHLGLDIDVMPKTKEALAMDLVAMMMAGTASKLDMEVEILPMVVQTMAARPPILFGTYDYVENALKTPATKGDPVWEQVKALRSACFDPRGEAPKNRLKEQAVDRKTWRGPW